MPYEIVVLTVLPVLIAAAGGVGATWMITSAWVRNKKNVRPEELGKIAEALKGLQHSVDDLRDDMRIQVNEIRELSGRVEFAERLLTEKKQDQVE